jgi:hypothetical protein
VIFLPPRPFFGCGVAAPNKGNELPHSKMGVLVAALQNLLAERRKK